ncbi:MAG TPA: GNAT family N-acetyltransferase, partial [Actinomycetota bacterium]|nr:GNAT family N-acetyltransferase [Actinomycetota bacterium]
AAGPRHAADLARRGRVLNRLISPVRKDTLFVSALAVAPTHRGRGYGTALLERIIAGAQHLGLGVALDAAMEDEVGRKLYARLGFREVDARPTTDVDRELIPVDGLVRMERPAGA